jgi:hypothetical protein
MSTIREIKNSIQRDIQTLYKGVIPTIPMANLLKPYNQLFTKEEFQQHQ